LFGIHFLLSTLSSYGNPEARWMLEKSWTDERPSVAATTLFITMHIAKVHFTGNQQRWTVMRITGQQVEGNGGG
jgi:hypothetical protein